MGRVFIALLLALCLAPAAFADGKVFRFGVAELPPIPDQQALICYDQQAQTQTLAIETRFRPADGPVQPYAWVVPLPGPAAPTITPATTGLFPTLRQIFQPRIIDQRSAGLGYLGVGLSIVIVLGLQLTWIRRSGVITFLLVLILCTCVIAFLLPALGTARSSGAIAGADIAVLDRSLVGDYEITTIAATPEAADPAKALAAWLEVSGFKQPPSVAPVLADYAKRNWVFACVKLLNLPKPSPDGTLTPHPLVFTFKTPQAVYPMALTGVGNGPLSLDLYVFASGTAHVPGMAVIRSSTTKAADPGRNYAMSPWEHGGAVAIGHPGLKSLVSRLPHATKLTSTLSPAQQASDLPITLTPFSATGETKYSKAGAQNSALDYAGGTLLLSVIGLAVVTALLKRETPWFNLRLGIPLVIAVAVGIGRWAILPTVETRSVSRMQSFRVIDSLERLGVELHEKFSGRESGPSLEEVQSVIAEKFITSRESPPREEDSPWNYTLTKGDKGRVEFTFYDAVGQPNIIDVWYNPERAVPKP